MRAWRPWIGSVTIVACLASGAAAGRRHAPVVDESPGSVLFHHEWRPDDALGHGDGLGPVYNAKSCVACHRQGGSGGAGPADRNVQIVTPIASGFSRGNTTPEVLGPLVKEQTRLPSLGSVVVHRFGTDPHYAPWRTRLLKLKPREFTLRRAERNTPALFGDGPIDAIPDAVLLEAEADGHPDFPEVHGRVSRLRDGRIGRFGWKGHTATLRDFVLTACSVELGLEVPGHHQSPDPTASGRSSHLLDLTEAECTELVDYVRSLPPPVQQDAEAVDTGKTLFAFVGCASCHAPRLGDVDGIYSDLLLHDMGPQGSDSVAYYETIINDGGIAQRESPTVIAAGPAPGEWRTPPLWGVADSAPYLHDGRARTLYDAIRLHGGEAAATVRRYKALTPPEQEHVLSFLLSLRAPGRVATRTRDGRAAIGSQLRGVPPVAFRPAKGSEPRYRPRAHRDDGARSPERSAPTARSSSSALAAIFSAASTSR